MGLLGYGAYVGSKPEALDLGNVGLESFQNKEGLDSSRHLAC